LRIFERPSQTHPEGALEARICWVYGAQEWNRTTDTAIFSRNILVAVHRHRGPYA
jgi:hypothetical protein